LRDSQRIRARFDSGFQIERCFVVFRLVAEGTDLQLEIG
jgi:hypothetical protein